PCTLRPDLVPYTTLFRSVAQCEIKAFAPGGQPEAERSMKLSAVEHRPCGPPGREGVFGRGNRLDDPAAPLVRGHPVDDGVGESVPRGVRRAGEVIDPREGPGPGRGERMAQGVPCGFRDQP